MRDSGVLTPDEDRSMPLLRPDIAAIAVLVALMVLSGCTAGEPRKETDAGPGDVDARDEEVDGAERDATPNDAAEVRDDAGTDGSGAPHADPLHRHCAESVGPPRVLEVAPDLFVAIGFDLANTILLRTADGNVVIDAAMSPARAEEVRAALDAVAPGPVRALIYTHSHIDHVGGASVWVEEGTEIWATDALLPGFLRQYGAFRDAEGERGRRQFGEHVDAEALPCNAIGARAGVGLASSTGFVPPTNTFSGRATLEVGGVSLELLELHGETDDQLGVWIPSIGAFLPGDNFYAAFPNLYSIRGTRPRSVTAWIASLDTMRSLQPTLLVPSHTVPVVGAEAVQDALRDYRDAIAWLQAEVTRRANRLEPIDAIVAGTTLPPHLAAREGLQERYGQVDWSVRAIYGQELGWFDGRAETLYPPSDLHAREISAMGGADAVEALALAALDDDDPQWAAHLLGKLRDSGLRAEAAIAEPLARAFVAIAASTENANGRGYLLERALELGGADVALPGATVSDVLLDALPPALIFEIMATRLRPETAMDVEEAMRVELTDRGETWTITVRRGVAEIRLGEPLPGTPAPVATVRTAGRVWVGMALDAIDPAAALIGGDLEVDELGGVLAFLARFESGI